MKLKSPLFSIEIYALGRVNTVLISVCIIGVFEINALDMTTMSEKMLFVIVDN